MTMKRERKINLAYMRLLAVIMKAGLALALVATADAGDNSKGRRHERRESHNYIIERQEAGAVQGVPTSRLIIGRREIDVYSNGLMFEGNNVVGVKNK